MRLFDLKEERVHTHAKGEGGSEDKGLHAFAFYLFSITACGLSVQGGVISGGRCQGGISSSGRRNEGNQKGSMCLHSPLV